MLAWAALQRPEAVLELVDRLESREWQWRFWQILFRDCTTVPVPLAEAGADRLFRLSGAVASEEKFLAGMEVLLHLNSTPSWEVIRHGIDTAYASYLQKSQVSQRLCRILLNASLHTPEVWRHPEFREVIQDHLQRILAHWTDDSSPDKENRKRLSEALREITGDFVRLSPIADEALADTFRQIVSALAPEGAWHTERAFPFPRDFALNVQRIVATIEKERDPSETFPQELRGVLGGFLNAFARAVSPERDPLGGRLATHFADLVLLASRSEDATDRVLAEKLLAELPLSAVPTIAVEVIASALTRNDFRTVYEWLPKAGGLLRSAIEDWEELIPYNEDGIELVMNMLRIDPAPEIINSSIKLFARACVRRDRDALTLFVEEGLTLFGLVRQE